MIHKLIENILAQNERSRSSDKLLLLEVWERQGLYFSEAQRMKFFEVASPETIRRVRQKLQEDGKYPASSSVRSRRRFKGMQMQQITPVATPKYVEQTLL